MNNFYFTMGYAPTSATGMPFGPGGYVLVKAKNKKDAVEEYNRVFALSKNGLYNYSFDYSEEEWAKTTMQDSKCHCVLEAIYETQD